MPAVYLPAAGSAALALQGKGIVGVADTGDGEGGECAADAVEEEHCHTGQQQLLCTAARGFVHRAQQAPVARR